MSDADLAKKNWPIILTDQKGAFREYNLQLGFFRDLWVADPIKIEPVAFEWDPSQNLTAYIHDIDIYGLMEIRFNASMFTHFNLTNLTTDLLDIYIDPSYELPDGFNMSDLNFTWNATFYNNTDFGYAVMKIQIYWNNASAISQMVEQDKIVWHIKQDFMGFFSPNVGKMLHKDYWTLRHRVRTQLDPYWKYWMDWVETSSYWVTGFLIGSFLFSQLPAGGNFRYFMWYMRTMQYVAHLPMLHTVLPPNAMRYFEIIFPVVTFNLIPQEYLSFKLFNFDFEKQREFLEESMHDQSEDLGYKSFNAVVILGTIWLFTIIYIIRVLLHWAVRWWKGSALFSSGQGPYEGGSKKTVKFEESKEAASSLEDEVLKATRQPKYIEKPMYLKVGGKFVKYMIKEPAPAEKAKMKKTKISYENNPVKKKNTWMTCEEFWSSCLLWCKIKCIEFWRWSIKTIYFWNKYLFYTVILGLLLEPYMEWCAAGIYSQRH